MIVPRSALYASVRFDNEHLDAVDGDPNAFRFCWRWSWLRFHWVPFDLCERRE